MEEQLKAYAPLCTQLDLHSGIPFTEKWSASPDFLQIIVGHCLETKPTTIMECSSGLTTLALARCCQRNGVGHVYSLENGAEYAAKAREYLARYELDAFATVIDAPLEKRIINDVEYAWYAIRGLPEASIDMLVIDGPPGFMQKHSRLPALPVLFGQLSAHCTIFLDDAARQDEREIVGLWQRDYPGLRHEYRETERGCSILTLDKGR